MILVRNSESKTGVLINRNYSTWLIGDFWSIIIIFFLLQAKGERIIIYLGDFGYQFGPRGLGEREKKPCTNALPLCFFFSDQISSAPRFCRFDRLSYGNCNKNLWLRLFWCFVYFSFFWNFVFFFFIYSVNFYSLKFFRILSWTNQIDEICMN